MRANEGPRKVRRRSTKAHSGQRRPTQANAGPYVSALRMFFFRVLFQTNYLIQVLFSRVQANAGPQRPTAANDGQRRPTQAHKDKKGPKRRVWRRLGGWAIICFFSHVQSICYFFITSRSTCSCFCSNKPRSEPEPALGPLLGPGSLLFEAGAVSSRA